MNKKELLKKIVNNKVLLFIVPNLIYIFMLLISYRSNFTDNQFGEFLFYEVFIFIFIFFIITILIYLILIKILKNKQYVFLVLCVIVPFYFGEFKMIPFLIFLVIILSIVLILKKHPNLNFDNAIVAFMFVIGFLTIINIVNTLNIGITFLIKNKNYDYDISINVDSDKKDTPDIYYIHCDAMIGIDIMKKYFNYDGNTFVNYLSDNNFYINTDASINAGHKTTRSLVALFNPYYYDNFYKEYLEGLENKYLTGKQNKFTVSYRELEEKRLNNELFKALKSNGYKTIAIGEYNEYTSLNVDSFYDYYYANDNITNVNSKYKKLRYINEDNSKFKKKLYTRVIHFKNIANYTFIAPLLKNINFLDYDEINYNDLDTTNYEYIDNSSYWISKAILKAIELENKNEDKKFTFIDFNLNHIPLTYDKDGNTLNYSIANNLDYYLGNYEYSTYLLMDMVSFIKNNDEDAVIILQADHGIHVLADEYLKNYFNTDINGVMEIRNSTMNAIYVPDKYKNGDEEYLSNPLNISRYLVNNYVGNNYKYID